MYLSVLKARLGKGYNAAIQGYNSAIRVQPGLGDTAAWAGGYNISISVGRPYWSMLHTYQCGSQTLGRETVHPDQVYKGKGFDL